MTWGFEFSLILSRYRPGRNLGGREVIDDHLANCQTRPDREFIHDIDREPDWLATIINAVLWQPGARGTRLASAAFNLDAMAPLRGVHNSYGIIRVLAVQKL